MSGDQHSTFKAKIQAETSCSNHDIKSVGISILDSLVNNLSSSGSGKKIYATFSIDITRNPIRKIKIQGYAQVKSQIESEGSFVLASKETYEFDSTSTTIPSYSFQVNELCRQ